MVQAVADREEAEVELEYLGTLNWDELSNLRPKPTGINLVGLVAEMWGKKGYTVEKKETRQGRYYSVVFNKDYVKDFIYNKVLVPLGIYQNGVLNRELLDEIIEATIEYAALAEEREQEKELLRMARTYIEERGLSQEQALELVKIQQKAMEDYLNSLTDPKK